MQAKDADVQRVVGWLADKPDGETAYCIARAMEWGEGRTANIVARGYELGVLVGILAPNSRCRNRKLVFTREHARGKPPQIVNPCIPAPDPMRLAASQERANRRAWPARRSASGVLMTRAPLPPDPRYHVARPQRCFSAMRPGEYLPGESLASRACGEAAAGAVGEPSGAAM